MLKILSLAAIGGFAALILPTAAQAQSPATQPLNPYPNEILTELLGSCVAERQRFNLTIPLNVASTKSVRTTTDEYIAAIDKKTKLEVERIEKQARSATEQVGEQSKNRQAELAELLRDREGFKAQIKQLKDALDNDQVPEGQRQQLEQLLKDLQDLQRDPSSITQKAERSRREMLQVIQENLDKERNQVRKTANKQRSLLTSCTCKIEAIQQRYTYPAFSKRALEEITIGPALSKDWAEVTQQCQK